MPAPNERFMRDTPPDVAEMQAAIHRKMTPAQRLALAMEMSRMAREFALARIRMEHPEWSEAEQKKELLRIAFGSAPLPEPLRR